MFCRNNITFLCFLLIHINIAFGVVLPGNKESELIDGLLRNYDPNARPRTDPQDSVKVHVDIALQRVVEVDEQSQTVTSAGKVKLVWRDDYLSWNETEYGGVKTLQLDQSRVWVPDAVIPSRTGGVSINNQHKGKVRVSSGGQLTLSTRGTFVTSCSVVLTKFPFDQHVCSIHIEPEISTGQEQVFAIMNSTSSISQDTAWSFATDSWSCPSIGQSSDQYSTCTLLFTVNRRENKQYIIPTITLIALSILGCFVFILSAKPVEKMTLILVIFATYTIVLVFGQEPHVTRQGYSYLSLYFVIEFGITSLMTIVTIFTVNLTCKDDLNISSCLEGFARAMTCKLKKHVNVISSERSDIVRAPGMDMAYKARTGKFSDSSGSEYVHEITWVDVAAGVDRLFFVLFLTVNIVLPVIIFSIIRS